MVLLNSGLPIDVCFAVIGCLLTPPTLVVGLGPNAAISACAAATLGSKDRLTLTECLGDNSWAKDKLLSSAKPPLIDDTLNISSSSIKQ